MSIPAKCSGWLGVHRFEARFDRTTNTGTVTLDALWDTAEKIAALADSGRAWTTYVRDVCVKCGAVIERTK